MATSNITVGIDEVGRGCLAGPVVAAAVILGSSIDGLNDSKKLTGNKRKKIAETIRSKALSIGIGLTDVNDVNEFGLTYAVSNAMRLALFNIKMHYDKIVIDGNYNFLPEQKSVSVIIKADETVPEVSAASIIAKVYRDELMLNLAKLYPNYGFENNVGYGTKQHLKMLDMYGPCELHRMFYKPLLKFKKTVTTIL